MKIRRLLVTVLALGLVSIGGFSIAQAAALPDQIPVQGRLTDANGVPLNGTFPIVFGVYNVADGGSLLCGNIVTPNVPVINGLFNVTLDLCATAGAVKGDFLYLGVKVGDDPDEMKPRLPIYAVPYAQSLRAGATVGGDIKQPLASDGLAKAGVLINNCGLTPSITRYFNNVNGVAITVSAGPSAGRCTLDLGFDRGSRYVVATPMLVVAPRIITINNNADNQKLDFYRFDELGVGQSGDIMVLVY